MMEIPEAYDEWSSQYDSNENKTRDLEKVAAQESVRSIAYSRVLELGCGTGKNTEWLVERAESLTALDFSEGMMALAKKKITSSRAVFRHADLTRPWPVESAAFDLVTCSLVLEHIENLDHIFSEASRCLEQGGHFYVCELHPFKQYKGTKARFERPGGTFELKVHVHHISDYVQSAFQHGFRVEDLHEWFDDDPDKPLPRLISFVFQRQ